MTRMTQDLREAALSVGATAGTTPTFLGGSHRSGARGDAMTKNTLDIRRRALPPMRTTGGVWFHLANTSAPAIGFGSIERRTGGDKR